MSSSNDCYREVASIASSKDKLGEGVEATGKLFGTFGLKDLTSGTSTPKQPAFCGTNEQAHRSPGGY